MTFCNTDGNGNFQFFYWYPHGHADTTSLETWFYLPNLKTIGAPPKWKMAIVSFIAAYSISLVAHSILS
ncbi:MAG: hypothetical protein WCF23_21290, partial [Candidatus Nitrosopolaris sp.]